MPQEQKGRSGRIALFLPTLNAGGAEGVMVNLAREIAEYGHPVDLVVADASGPLLNRVAAGVRLVDLQCVRVLASLVPLIRYLRAERPIGLLSTLGHANIIALWARILSRVPVRVVVRETSTPSVALVHARRLRSRCMPLIARLFYPIASGIVAASEGMAEDLARFTRLPRERIRVIYNPAIGSDLYARAAETVSHHWFAPGEPPVILGVGRLTPAKDFPVLVEAFARVRAITPARLLILGEGEERGKIEAKARQLGIASEVDLPGYVINPFPYMRQAAVFVLSSAWEGLPNVLIEALALRTPVVATDCRSGPREILKGGGLGHLVPVGDPATLAAAIAEVLAGKRFSVTDGDLDRFRSDDVTQSYLELILGGQAGG